MNSMYFCQPACPNKYYWLSASVEVSVTYHYYQKVHAICLQVQLLFYV